MVSMNRLSRSGDIGTARPKTKPRRSCDRRGSKLGRCSPGLALARLVARVGLVDHIDPALATNDAAILVPLLRRLQRIDDLHGSVLEFRSLGRARNIEIGTNPVNPRSERPKQLKILIFKTSSTSSSPNPS